MRVGSPRTSTLPDETYLVRADGHINAAFEAGKLCHRIGWVVKRIASKNLVEYERDA